jgi:hypothetical protein
MNIDTFVLATGMRWIIIWLASRNTHPWDIYGASLHHVTPRLFWTETIRSFGKEDLVGNKLAGYQKNPPI